jgi:hypothetical protein
MVTTKATLEPDLVKSYLRKRRKEEKTPNK